MKKQFLSPSQIADILIKNIKDPDSVFIFPTDTVLNSWADFLILNHEKTNVQAIPMERFIAWDKFKSHYLHATKEGFDTIPSILKKFFVHDLILKNAQAPAQERFQVIINPDDEYASNAFSFSTWIYKNLSSLNLLEKRYKQNPDYQKDDEDLDYEKLYYQYKNFLEQNRLYEPSWIDDIEFDTEGKHFFLFYPEIIEDFGDFIEIFERCDDFNVFEFPKNTPNVKAYFYKDSRTELRQTILRIIELVQNKKADWSDIALSIPDIDTYRPYLEREFAIYNIPYVIKSGIPLTKNSAARIFKEISDCYTSNYSFEKVRSLLLDECVPWQEQHKKNREALVRVGNELRTICSVDEKNIWFVAINQKKRNLELKINFKKAQSPLPSEDIAKLQEELNDYEEIGNFFGKLKHFVDAFFAIENDFSSILICWQAFKTYFLQDDSEFSSEANNILGRAICELKEIIEIEKKFKDCRLTIQNPFLFFISELDAKKYTPQQTEKTGINVFPYRLSAMCSFKYQFVIDASQKNLEVPYKKLTFLNATKRNKLHLTDDDKLSCASEVFIKLYDKIVPFSGTQNENPLEDKNSAIEKTFVSFSSAEDTFSGFAIPHFYLDSMNSDIDCKDFLSLIEKDYILNEKKFLLAQNFSDKQNPSSQQNECNKKRLVLTKNQQQQFKTWVHKNDSSVEPNKNNDVTYKINDKMIEKIHFLLVENRNGTDIQTSKTLSNENVKISARSDLENFFPCPRKWIFKTVLKLKEDSLDTDLMQPYDIGNLNHKVLELFVSSFTGKKLPFYDETSKSFKIADDEENKINPSSKDFTVDLKPFIEKAIISTQNIKDCPLVMQSLKAQTNKIQENLIGFLRKFLLPFGVTPNCKRGFEKMNGVGNCTVFACEKSFTAGNEDAKSAENVSSSHSFQYFGKIDALLLSPQNDWIVIDYKNSKIPAVQDIFADENDILKDFQMSVYFKLIKEQKIHEIAAGTFYSIQGGNTNSAVDIFATKKTGDEKDASYEPCKMFEHFKPTMDSLKNYAQTFENMVNPKSSSNLPLFDSKDFKSYNFLPYTSNDKTDILNTNVYENCMECNFKTICRTTYTVGRKTLPKRKEKEKFK